MIGRIRLQYFLLALQTKVPPSLLFKGVVQRIARTQFRVLYESGVPLGSRLIVLTLEIMIEKPRKVQALQLPLMRGRNLGHFPHNILLAVFSLEIRCMTHLLSPDMMLNLYLLVGRALSVLPRLLTRL